MHILIITITTCLVWNLSFFLSLSAKEALSYALQDGDIVFTGSAQGQGSAIIAATGSSYTHCGIIFQRDGRWMVLEAVQPVGVATLEDFMARDSKKAFVALRLKSAVADEDYKKAREWASAQIGRDYDVRFGWDDHKLYCSELVWKFYQKAGVELCPPKKFREYDLRKPEVKMIIAQRFGGMAKVPMEEKVVAPSDLAASALLVEVPKLKE